MTVPALDWRTITSSRDNKFFVKGTPLAVAFYLQHRFGIYEMRGPRRNDGGYDDYYIVKDAQTVGDDGVRLGQSPLVVYRTDVLDLGSVIAWCDAN